MNKAVFVFVIFVLVAALYVAVTYIQWMSQLPAVTP
jgi:hypothetical protein